MGIYDFPDNALLRSRMSRLESNAPFLRGGKSGQNKGQFRPVVSSAVDSGGNIDPTGSGIMTVGSLERVTETKPFTANAEKVSVHMPQVHLFWANRFLSHKL